MNACALLPHSCCCWCKRVMCMWHHKPGTESCPLWRSWMSERITLRVHTRLRQTSTPADPGPWHTDSTWCEYLICGSLCASRRSWCFFLTWCTWVNALRHVLCTDALKDYDGQMVSVCLKRNIQQGDCSAAGLQCFALHEGKRCVCGRIHFAMFIWCAYLEDDLKPGINACGSACHGFYKT